MLEYIWENIITKAFVKIHGIFGYVLLNLV